MSLSKIYAGLGPDNLQQQLRAVSLGKLRTFQLFDRFKTRLRLGKLNQEALRNAAPKVWARLEAGEDELATDLSQAVLVSHMDMIVAALDFLGVPHNDGFFDKDADVKSHLSGDWQQRCYDQLAGRFPQAVLVFYLNHLAHEVFDESPLFQPGRAQ